MVANSWEIFYNLNIIVVFINTTREGEMRITKLMLSLFAAAFIFTSLTGCGGDKKPVVIEIDRTDYIGCYRDRGDAGGAWGRDLDKFFYNSNNMTIPQCIQDCKALGHKYAGLQSRNQCFCGDSYGKFGAAEGECTKRCIGDKETMCGGTWANSIYETGARGE
jgi:WSC domain-containing protein